MEAGPDAPVGGGIRLLMLVGASAATLVFHDRVGDIVAQWGRTPSVNASAILLPLSNSVIGADEP